MAYDDTSAYPTPPAAPAPTSAGLGFKRAHLIGQLVLAAFLAFYSALLGLSTLLPILAGRGADAINVFLLATWSVAGLVCAIRCLRACGSVLIASWRSEV
ncbi:hypothetical protein [Caulobacter sp. BP25]|uniref:hypothetical protein n=1 Tax=Caulobacter sp. BP25 TaxID=2048900 RepID=UPI000C12CFA3|nr:hypothetical protein [Caulobacter sp. BP25]PHY20900.1 hypothetical protein CSW59_06730 [Caulobacter sp. BP25]